MVIIQLFHQYVKMLAHISLKQVMLIRIIYLRNDDYIYEDMKVKDLLVDDRNISDARFFGLDGGAYLIYALI